MVLVYSELSNNNHRTRVSRIVGRRFTVCANRDANISFNFITQKEMS